MNNIFCMCNFVSSLLPITMIEQVFIALFKVFFNRKIILDTNLCNIENNRKQRQTTRARENCHTPTHTCSSY